MKRIKKTLMWTGIIVGGLVAIGLVANAAFIWITHTRLEREIAAVREAGDPLTLVELAPKPVPPDKNAATYPSRHAAHQRGVRDRVEVFRQIGIHHLRVPGL